MFSLLPQLNIPPIAHFLGEQECSTAQLKLQVAVLLPTR
jgi:hypothetical protein